MSTIIIMPQLGESVAEGVIGKWLKAEGDPIAKDEPIVEVITDKVNAEIPSPVAGVLQKISQPEGATVAIGDEIGVIGDGTDQSQQPEPAAAEAASGGQSPGAGALGGNGQQPGARIPAPADSSSGARAQTATATAPVTERAPAGQRAE